MTSHRCSLAGNTFHRAAIAEDDIGVVVDQFEFRLVEFCGSDCLCDCKADGVGEALTKRTGSDLDTWCIVRFRMAGCDAIDLLCGCQPSGTSGL